MPDWTPTDHRMMKRVISLARRGRVWVAPNPMVGAVVAKNGTIIGEGWHRHFGDTHAEVNALEAAGDEKNGADLYVNLEPCSHFGKTPPCTELIIRSGIRRVVTAIVDPNPLVNGSGLKQLRKAGLQVEVGLLAKKALELNQPYVKKALTGIAWVTLKIAQSLDGRIASTTGHSRWITCKASRRHAHDLRAEHDAVLVGAGTVKADDPMLNVRHVRGRNPLRIVLDTNFSIPPECRLLNTPEIAPTLVFGSPENGKLPVWADRSNVEAVIVTRNENGLVDLREMLDNVSRRGVISLMVEGGSGIWTAFLGEGLADDVELFIAPVILGQGIDAIRDLGVLKVDDAVRLEPFRWRKVGGDWLVSARINHRENR